MNSARVTTFNGYLFALSTSSTPLSHHRAIIVRPRRLAHFLSHLDAHFLSHLDFGHRHPSSLPPPFLLLPSSPLHLLHLPSFHFREIKLASETLSAKFLGPARPFKCTVARSEAARLTHTVTPSDSLESQFSHSFRLYYQSRRAASHWDVLRGLGTSESGRTRRLKHRHRPGGPGAVFKSSHGPCDSDSGFRARWSGPARPRTVRRSGH
eukprot:748439-Hanusia_phi.AAC.3